MRMKMVCDNRTLRDVANEFLALKKAQKARERTLSDYKKYIDKFLTRSQNTLDVDVLKIEIAVYLSVLYRTSKASPCQGRWQIEQRTAGKIGITRSCGRGGQRL